jgi:hypothetical protein
VVTERSASVMIQRVGKLLRLSCGVCSSLLHPPAGKRSSRACAADRLLVGGFVFITAVTPIAMHMA